MTTLQRSQSSQTSSGPFQQQTQQKENNLVLCWTFQHLVWTSPLNHQVCQRQIQPPTEWLRVAMSYHRFANLREIFQGHLSRKLTVGLTSQNRTKCYIWLPEHVQKFNTAAVHKVKCNNTGKACMGNTQQKFKARMEQHFNEVQNLSNFVGEKLASVRLQIY